MKENFWKRFLTITTFIVTYLLLAYFYQPRFLFSLTTTNGGDTGSHHYIAYYLSEYLLPRGSLTGWSPDWYAGFPMLRFYFPLPYLIISLLSYLISYEIAFKLVTVLGVFIFPAAVYYFSRCLKVGYPFPQISALFTLPFLFLESYSIYGGNILSTLAGEFPFSLSLALYFVFLGKLYIEMENKKRIIFPSLLLAAITHSHILSTIAAVIISPVILISKDFKKRLIFLIKIFSIAFLLTAWWSIPFLLNLEFTAGMKWDKLTEIQQLFTPGFSIIFFLAFIGIIATIIKKERALILPLWQTFASLILFFILPSGPLWNARFIPFFLTGSLIIGAYGLYYLCRLVSDIISKKEITVLIRWVATTFILSLFLIILYLFNILLQGHQQNRIIEKYYLIGIFLLIVFLPSLKILTKLKSDLKNFTNNIVIISLLMIVPTTIIYLSPTVPSWIKWNYSGYEAKKDWPTLHRLMAYLAKLPKSRILWEYSPEIDRFGTPRALELIPFFSRQSTMEGLLIESASTAPFHFILQAETSNKATHAVQGIKYPEVDLKKGLEHMRLFNIRYFIAYSEEIKAKASLMSQLRLQKKIGPFNIYELDEGLFVSIPEYQVNLLTKGNWRKNSIKWMKSELSPDIPIVYGTEIPNNDEKLFKLKVRSLKNVKKIALPDMEVDGLEVDSSKVIFTTSHIGQPHIIKYSYFPNWKANGAKGPYLVSPSLMLVIPTQREVVLEYKTSVTDRLSFFLSLLTYLALFLFGISKRQVLKKE